MCPRAPFPYCLYIETCELIPLLLLTAGAHLRSQRRLSFCVRRFFRLGRLLFADNLVQLLHPLLEDVVVDAEDQHIYVRIPEIHPDIQVILCPKEQVGCSQQVLDLFVCRIVEVQFHDRGFSTAIGCNLGGQNP